MLDLGTVQRGEQRTCRIVIRNRGLREINIDIDASNAPFVTAVFSNKPLAAGLPRVVDVRGGPPGDITDEIEHTGKILVRAWGKVPANAAAEHYEVPVYAHFISRPKSIGGSARDTPSH